MRLWMLWLVPPGRYGRLVSGGATLVLLLSMFWYSGVLDGFGRPGGIWGIAMFFSLVIAYCVPVCHFIDERTRADFDALRAHLVLDEATLERERGSISHKPRLWQACVVIGALALWAFQSVMLARGGGQLEEISTKAEIALTAGPILVWLVVTTAVAALVDNARLFRRLGRHVEMDLTDPRITIPIGRMAVSSTLVVIGLLALFPVMWIAGTIDPWTTIPGVVGTCGALVFMFLAPIWPVHLRIREAKRAELDRIQLEISTYLAGAEAGIFERSRTLAPLLVYRREIASLPEWPFDLGVITRFGLYLVIVPLTWIGAALIEIIVDAVLAN